MRKALAQPHTKQFLKFAVVGLISFGIDWGMLIALVELFHLDFLMSTTVSFITSVVVNYWLSMKYVFDHREGMSRKREFTIFTILSVIGLGLNYVSSGTPTAGIYGSWQGENYNRTITSVNGSELNLNTRLKELFTENSYESAAITYQITSTGTWTYLTLVDSEGTVTTYGGQDSGLKASGFGALTSFTYGTDYVKYLVVDNTTLQAGASQEANLNAIAAAAVPEPATASLSLIGLAALMMRRRRA